jgi:hypothetical protein
MRIVSWNVRGLNGLEKRKEVKELVREKVPFVLCIQETKLQLIDDFLCNSIWGLRVMITLLVHLWGRQEG